MAADRADTLHAAHGTGARPAPPGLHLIATPIGAARDITLRALDLLAGADILAAEDTRSLRHLMELHGVPLAQRPLLPYHDHNGPRMRPRLIEALERGESVVYAAEAGTPMVADPGYQLVREALAQGIEVHAAPGPSALLAALVVSGLPSDRFCFMGFAPAQGSARQKFLEEAATIPATVVLYESPHRIQKMLRTLVSVFGEEREAALCRELTKRFEEVLRMPLGQLAEAVSDRTLKGEIVLLVDRKRNRETGAVQLDEVLMQAMNTQPLKAAVAEVSEALGLPRREVYQAALRLRDAP